MSFNDVVEKHRADLMRKLDLRNAVELGLLAVEVGMIHRTELAKDLPGEAAGAVEGAARTSR